MHYLTLPACTYGYIQGSGNLRLAVRLPEGEDLNEWLAVHGAHIHLHQCLNA